MEHGEEQRGLLVLHAWFDEGSPALRMKLRATNDVREDLSAPIVLHDAESACVSVAEWLESFIRQVRATRDVRW